MKYHANQELVTRVQQSTGLTRRESQVAVIATTAAIIEQLMAGREVQVTNLGVFYFRMTPGRVVPKRSFPGGRTIPSATIKARPVLKFQISKNLREQLVGVEPDVVYPMHASPRPTPIPIPSPGGSASPNNPPTGDEAA